MMAAKAKPAAAWEATGVLLITILGPALYFAFAWTG